MGGEGGRGGGGGGGGGLTLADEAISMIHARDLPHLSRGRSA